MAKIIQIYNKQAFDYHTHTQIHKPTQTNGLKFIAKSIAFHYDRFIHFLSLFFLYGHFTQIYGFSLLCESPAAQSQYQILFNLTNQFIVIAPLLLLNFNPLLTFLPLNKNFSLPPPPPPPHPFTSHKSNTI